MTGISPVAGAASAGFGKLRHSPTPSSQGSAKRDRDERRPQRDWHQALTELEGEVLAAEETMARGRAEEIAAWGRRSESWRPASDLGPIPADLRERAMRLLQHQLAVAEALIERITQSQKQRDVAARMSYGPDRPVPSFIDRGL